MLRYITPDQAWRVKRCLRAGKSGQEEVARAIKPFTGHCTGTIESRPGIDATPMCPCPWHSARVYVPSETEARLWPSSEPSCGCVANFRRAPPLSPLMVRLGFWPRSLPGFVIVYGTPVVAGAGAGVGAWEFGSLIEQLLSAADGCIEAAQFLMRKSLIKWCGRGTARINMYL